MGGKDACAAGIEDLEGFLENKLVENPLSVWKNVVKNIAISSDFLNYYIFCFEKEGGNKDALFLNR